MLLIYFNYLRTLGSKRRGMTKGKEIAVEKSDNVEEKSIHVEQNDIDDDFVAAEWNKMI